MRNLAVTLWKRQKTIRRGALALLTMSAILSSFLLPRVEGDEAYAIHAPGEIFVDLGTNNIEIFPGQNVAVSGTVTFGDNDNNSATIPPHRNCSQSGIFVEFLRQGNVIGQTRSILNPHVDARGTSASFAYTLNYDDLLFGTSGVVSVDVIADGGRTCTTEPTTLTITEQEVGTVRLAANASQNVETPGGINSSPVPASFRLNAPSDVSFSGDATRSSGGGQTLWLLDITATEDSTFNSGVTITATPDDSSLAPQSQQVNIAPTGETIEVNFTWDTEGEATEPEIENEPDPIVDPNVGDDTDITSTSDFCASENFDQLGSLRWIIASLIENACSILDVNIALAFPLMDVTIPLVAGDQVTIRLMFNSTAILGETAAGESLAADAEAIFGGTYTPIAVYELWIVTLNIAYSFVVLGMVISSFFIIYRWQPNKYNAQQLLLNTFFAIILAGFSYQISTLLFDLNRIAAYIIRDTMAVVSANISGGATAETAWDDMAEYTSLFLTGGLPLLLGGAAIFTGGLAAIAAGACAVAALIPFCGCIFAYMVSLIMMVFVMLFRMLFLYAMVIVSPIVFIAGIVPELRGLQRNWLRSFVTALAMYPLAVLVYYVVFTVMISF